MVAQPCQDRGGNAIKSTQQAVGLIPAAGTADRLPPLPCSKEIYPIGHCVEEGCETSAKVACHYLLERMTIAEVATAYIVIRDGKWDIPRFLKNGNAFNIRLAYLMMDLPFGVPFSIDQAFPFLKGETVVFGFPDILFHPKDAFLHLLDRQAETNASLVLGVFPSDNPKNADVVHFDENQKVKKILIKPPNPISRYVWTIAVWDASFSLFLHDFVNRASSHAHPLKSERPAVRDEVFLGHVFQSALKEGLTVETVRFDNGGYIDIGTPERLHRTLTERFFHDSY